MEVEKKDGGWVLSVHDPYEIVKIVEDRGLRGLYDTLLRATKGVSYEDFDGNIDVTKIHISEKMGVELERALESYYAAKGAPKRDAQIVAMQDMVVSGPSANMKGEDNIIRLDEGVFIEEKREEVEIE